MTNLFYFSSLGATNLFYQILLILESVLFVMGLIKVENATMNFPGMYIAIVERIFPRKQIGISETLW